MKLQRAISIIWWIGFSLAVLSWVHIAPPVFAWIGGSITLVALAMSLGVRFNWWLKLRSHKRQLGMNTRVQPAQWAGSNLRRATAAAWWTPRRAGWVLWTISLLIHLPAWIGWAPAHIHTYAWWIMIAAITLMFLGDRWPWHAKARRS